MTGGPDHRVQDHDGNLGSHPGEIVVFKDPGDWLPDPVPGGDSWRARVRDGLTFIGVLPSDSGDDLVKRVIGVAGDRVACCDAEGRIVVNGVPLDEDYIIGRTDQVRFDVTVPPASMFVMGDNRANSRDSRYHLDLSEGGVPESNAVGRVVLVVWPFSHLARSRFPPSSITPHSDSGDTPSPDARPRMVTAGAAGGRCGGRRRRGRPGGARRSGDDRCGGCGSNLRNATDGYS